MTALLTGVMMLFATLSAPAFTLDTVNKTAATDGSWADVQAAINSAVVVDGWTVKIPAGNYSWASGVAVSKNITLAGAGGGRIEGSSESSLTIGTGLKSFTIRNKSTITGFVVNETVVAHNKHSAVNFMQGTVSSWDGTTLVLNVTNASGSGTVAHWVFESPEATKITHDAGSGTLMTVNRNATGSPVLTGFRLVKGTGTGYGITVNGSGKPALIHDLRISKIHQGIRDNSNGSIIWHFYADAGFDIGNNTLNNDNAIQVKGGSPTSWSTPNTVGVNDLTGNQNVYIEDSYFVGLVLGAVDCADNSRTVIRHSVLDNSGITIHGQDTDWEGMRHLEMYDNPMIFNALPQPSAATANMNYWITWRGGAGIFTDNIVDDINSWAWSNKLELTLEYQPLRHLAGPNACYSGGYPAPRQPGQGSNASGYIPEGVYIWNNTGTANVSPVDYSPDECGGGQSISTFIQFNRDYFYTAPASGTPYYPYQKFTYPHPLRSGIAPPTGTPHPADTNSDYLMALNEATKYGACWKNPSAYADCPTGIAIDYAVRAGTLWSGSPTGQYQYNSNNPCPLCWEVKP